MQLSAGKIPPSVFQSFSILGRIGGDATETKQMLDDLKEEPFSILGRIGGDATRP